MIKVIITNSYEIKIWIINKLERFINSIIGKILRCQYIALNVRILVKNIDIIIYVKKIWLDLNVRISGVGTIEIWQPELLSRWYGYESSSEFPAYEVWYSWYGWNTLFGNFYFILRNWYEIEMIFSKTCANCLIEIKYPLL